MHAKGHTDIYGNKRADALADEGAKIESDVFKFRAIEELGGPVRFAEKCVRPAIVEDIATWSANTRARNVHAK